MLQNLRPIEVILIVGILLLLFGAKKLPQLAKGVGESLKIFKKEISDVTAEEPAPAPVAAEADSVRADQRTAVPQADPRTS